MASEAKPEDVSNDKKEDDKKEDDNKNDNDDKLDIMKMPLIEDYTPLTKLNNNLCEYLCKKTDAEYTFVILLTTGALNPVHLGHVDIMESAKIEIEKQHANIKVIAGFMSPSHDSYLSGKFGRNKFIESIYRIKMVEMATCDSNWITFDEWECKQNGFIDFPAVSSKMIEKLKQIYCDKYIKSSKFKIYYVSGLDHANRCNLLQGRLNRIGVNTLIVRRPNAKLNHIKLKSNIKKGVIVVDAPPVNFDRSSTIVRNLLIQNKWKELEKYLNVKVIQYFKHDPDKILKNINFSS